MGRWAAAVAGIVAKCEVAAKFGGSAVWNTDGADALGKLIKEMARLLDIAAAAFPAGIDTPTEKDDGHGRG